MRSPTKRKQEEVDFKAYITRDFFRRPEMLLMDYINGRDCRTKVYKQAGRWLFDKYAFEQREVSAQEFVQSTGKEDINSQGFLQQTMGGGVKAAQANAI